MFLFSKLFSFIFLGQIWRKNLKFFKLSEIWYRGRCPCFYFHFNVYIFKILFIHILGQILFQNLKFFRLTEILYRDRLPYTYLDFNVYFFKKFFTHIFGANFVPKSEVLQIDRNLVQR